MSKMQGRHVCCALLLLITIAANGLQHLNYGKGCCATAIKMVHPPYCLVMCCTRSLYHHSCSARQRLRFPTWGTPLVSAAESKHDVDQASLQRVIDGKFCQKGFCHRIGA